MEDMDIAIVTIASATALAADLLISDDEENEVVLEKTDNFFEITIPNFNDNQFKQHFRILPETFDWLISYLHVYEREETESNFNGRPRVELEKQFFCFLWYLANREAFRSVADRFGIAKQSAWTFFHNICHKMMRLNKERQIIKFPVGDEANDVMTKFEAKNGFPGIVGVVDGCHIRIEKPKDHGDSYINRKGYASVLLQGICNSDKTFIDVYAGEPGSIHDQRLLYKSDIYNKIRRGTIEIPNNGFLIGDLAYKLSTNLIVGFKNNGHLTNDQARFNFILNQNRIVIENTFGLLKGRFRRLKHIESKRLDLIPLIIVVGCIMHNICQIRGDFYDGPLDEEDDLNIEDAEIEDDNMEAIEKRENLMFYVLRNDHRNRDQN